MRMGSGFADLDFMALPSASRRVLPGIGAHVSREVCWWRSSVRRTHLIWFESGTFPRQSCNKLASRAGPAHCGQPWRVDSNGLSHAKVRENIGENPHVPISLQLSNTAVLKFGENDALLLLVLALPIGIAGF